jgi:hypothetical protein
MSEMKKAPAKFVPPKFFYVRFTTTVDRPELRGPSFLTVAPGTKVPNEMYFPTQAGAVMMFESLMAGEYDFPGEYVSSASVEQRNSYGENRRSVRKGGFRKADPFKRMRYCADCREAWSAGGTGCKTCEAMKAKYNSAS